MIRQNHPTAADGTIICQIYWDIQCSHNCCKAKPPRIYDQPYAEVQRQARAHGWEERQHRTWKCPRHQEK